jgi:hypothetical protein
MPTSFLAKEHVDCCADCLSCAADPICRIPPFDCADGPMISRRRVEVNGPT